VPGLAKTLLIKTLAALEIAPSYERAQDLLLKLTEPRP